MSTIDQSVNAFIETLTHALNHENLEKLRLSKYRGAERQLKRLTVRPVLLKQGPSYSFVYQYQTRDITKNYRTDDAIAQLHELITNDFKSITLRTTSHQVQCEISKKGKALIRTTALQPKSIPNSTSDPSSISGQQASTSTIVVDVSDTDSAISHDRQKKRYVDIKRPFLTALKVTDKEHQLIPAMSRKWKQINKFIEILSGALTDAELNQKQSIQVVDFGSGKGYLTFALHDYLRHQLKNDADVTGVELRAELTELCNQAAKKLDHQGLNFVCGDVKTHAPKQTDVMIALHACDIATDYAIHYGIRANASIIMCSPCCHKQIRPQLKSPVLLKPMLQYGVHLGQQAEMVTDSMRALLLEAYGYSTKVFEFVSLEHTNKNKMILAIKKPANNKKQKVLSQIAELKSYYGIQEHCLETLLAELESGNH